MIKEGPHNKVPPSLSALKTPIILEYTTSLRNLKPVKTVTKNEKTHTHTHKHTHRNIPIMKTPCVHDQPRFCCCIAGDIKVNDLLQCSGRFACHLQTCVFSHSFAFQTGRINRM